VNLQVSLALVFENRLQILLVSFVDFMYQRASLKRHHRLVVGGLSRYKYTCAVSILRPRVCVIEISPNMK
jgi:hypothetical protein